MIRAVFFLGMGLILGGVAASFVGPPGAGAWAIGTGIPVASMALVFWLVARSLRGTQPEHPLVAAAAVKAGRVGMARVDSIRETGTRINDQPLCELEITVQPRVGQPYRTRLRRILGFEKRARLAPGSVHPVAILIEGEPDVGFLKPEEVSDPSLLGLPVPSSAAAGELRIPKSGKLRSNGKRSKPLIGSSRRWLPLRAVLYVIMLCAGAALVLLPLRSAVELSLASQKATGSWIADMRTELGISAALDALEQKVGHDRVSQVNLYKDFVLIDAPVGPSTLNTDTWYYRGGELSNDGPASTQPESEEEFFRTSEVNWKDLWPAVQSKSQGFSQEITDDIGIFAERSKDYDNESVSFMQNNGPVVFRFNINEPYSSTSYTMDSHGKNITED